MCNCNQKRMQYATSVGNKNTPQLGMAKVRLIRSKPLLLFGDVTGREYQFKQRGDIQWVDKTDMPYMRGLPGIEILG